MSYAEIVAKYGTISWIPMVVFFLIAIACNLWGKQWHMAGFIIYVVVGLGLWELFVKLQTDKTISQWQIIWATQSMRDFILSWVSLIALIVAMVMLSHHLK